MNAHAPATPATTYAMRPSWDTFFLSLARKVAQRSKDPSTKCGAVIARPNNRLVSVGYNGFPAGVRDTAERLEDRGFKYPAVIHAEENAILAAEGRSAGCTIYTSYEPCGHCAAVIAQAGIVRVVYQTELPARWSDSCKVAAAIFKDAGVEVAALPQAVSKRRVVIESPFGAPDAAGVEANVKYARACVRDAVLRGEAPIASHLLFTQPGILRDEDEAERALGIECGFAWNMEADLVAVYEDRGHSRGMRQGIDFAQVAGIPVEFRRLSARVSA